MRISDRRRRASGGDQYLLLPGVAGNYASTPDSAALSITGDLDLRVRCALNDWTPSASNANLIAKYTATGNQRSYRLQVTTTGALRLTLSEDGTAAVLATSSVATGVADGAIKWVCATWRGSDGRTQFFTSDDGSTWAQLGTDQTLSVASIFDSTAVVEIGAETAGVGSLAAGKFHRAQIYNGIGGTLAYDAHFADLRAVRAIDTSLVEASANAAVVTIHQSGGNVARIVRL